jgi:pimeloyl-ACP methyl ester carboxylesterase
VLHVESTGSGPPVVLLHSSGMSSRQFAKLIPKLVEAGFRAIAIDLAGHGRSPMLGEGAAFGWRDDVQAVRELLAEPAFLVGHSYGGLVALHVGLAAADRVKGLVLYDPVAFGILDERDADVMTTLAQLDLNGGATLATRDEWLRSFVDYWGGQGAWQALREPARDEFRRVGWAVREGVRTLMADATKAPAYAALPPLALITGEHTPVAERRVIDRLAAATGASVSVISGAGHMGPLSHADAVNARIVELLRAF